MGIDIHGLNFLRYAHKKKAFGAVATIGRQSLMVAPARRARIMGTPVDNDSELYCEAFLVKHLSATLVDSYDYSDYEKATHIADMNNPLATTAAYDSVLDCGSSEHVFNVPQALQNISRLCRDGGQIIHVLPANNFCGHGFWQFSPELFFSLYSPSNGYSETEVFLADLRRANEWFEVLPPGNGKRAEVTSAVPLYLLCRTRKTRSVQRLTVQQSDYIHTWESGGVQKSGRRSGWIAMVKKIVERNRIAYQLAVSGQQTLNKVMKPTRLSARNPFLRKRNVRELLASDVRRA